MTRRQEVEEIRNQRQISVRRPQFLQLWIRHPPTADWAKLLHLAQKNDMLSPGLLLLPALGCLSLYLLYHKRTASRSNTSPSVAIVVLGDIGRSPRMLFHAMSLVESGLKVVIVAYRGEFNKIWTVILVCVC